MRSRTMRIGLGLFALGCLVLMGVLIILFDSMPGLFKPGTPYTIRFTDAQGVAPGAPVRRSGVRIGEVTSVNLDDEIGIVRVRISLNLPHRLRKSDLPTIVTGLLGSDAGIDLIPKMADARQPLDHTPLEPGAVVDGARAATVNTLIKGASDVVPSAQDALNDIRKSMQSLEKLAARVEKSVPLAEDTLQEYRNLAQRAQKSIPEVEKTNSQIQELIRSIREVVPEAQRTTEEVRLLSRDVRAALPEVQKTNKEIAELSRSIREAVPVVVKTVEEIEGLASDVRKSIPKVNGAIDDIAALARTTNGVVEDLGVFWKKNRDEVENSLHKINSALTQINALLSDDNIKSINRTIKNIETTSDGFPQLARDFGDVGARARTTLDTLNKTTLPEFNKAVKNFNETTIPQFNALLKNANETALPELSRLMKTINDTTVPEINKFLNGLTDILPQVKSLIKSANDTTLPQINKVLSNATETTLPEFNALLATARTTTLPQINGLLGNINTSTVPQINSLLKSANETTLPQVNILLRRMDITLADVGKITSAVAARSDRLAANVEESVLRINQVLGDVSAMMRVIDKSEGTLRKFLTDPSLYNNIDNAAVMLTRIMPRVDRILKDFEIFADKVARHPESIGLRGVVAPSTGLKNPPTPPLSHQPGTMVPQHHPVYSPQR